MSEIKAIETVYNGYKFRSRLEARWAVFFDAAGIKYEYEPEGFKNKKGDCYLPDFYLPYYGFYVEVKPNDCNRLEEIRKAAIFIGDKMQKLLLLPEIPEKRNDNSVFWYTVIYNHPLITFYPLIRKVALEEYYDSDESDEIVFEAEDKVSDQSEHTVIELFGEYYSWGSVHDSVMRGEQRFNTYHSVTPTLDYAYDRARMARFEHGECG